jgi:hypothetical protein
VHDEVDCTDLEMAICLVMLFLWMSLRTVFGLMTTGLQLFLAQHQQASLDIVGLCWCEQFHNQSSSGGRWFVVAMLRYCLIKIFQWNLKSSPFFSNQNWTAWYLSYNHIETHFFQVKENSIATQKVHVTGVFVTLHCSLTNEYVFLKLRF